MMECSKMTVLEIEELLTYWENVIDGCRWSEENRNDVVDLVTSMDWTLQQWKDHLVKVPDNVEDRYRKVMKMLLDDQLITQEAYEYELKVMNQFSPVRLTRQGKAYAEWWRSEQSRMNVAA